jgi:hypothetical protein
MSSTRLRVGVVGLCVEPATQVLVAEAVESLVPLGEESKQLIILLLPRIETPVALAVLADSVAGRCNDLFESSVPLWCKSVARPLSLVAPMNPAATSG